MNRKLASVTTGLMLAVFACVLSLNFYDWPVNRDITTYAVFAQELRHGKALYLELFDTKPPAIFVVYMLSQSLFASKSLQFTILHIVPSLMVLIALLKCGSRAGFNNFAGPVAGLTWVILSGDIRLQMQWPNTELFINAFSVFAILQFLSFDDRDRTGTAISIGILFAIACLFKTVAIAMAFFLGLAHVLCPPAGVRRSKTVRDVLVMASSGTAVIALVVLYFALTNRFQVFKEAMIDSGVSYAGSIGQNIIEGITLAPFTGDNLALRVAIATVPWLIIAGIARIDWQRRRSWILLGAYAFSALVAVGMPGKFYAHYFQLLVPPLCLGIGWLADLLLFRLRDARGMILAAIGLLALGLGAFEARQYRVPPEAIFEGTYAELYLETRALGQRLGEAMGEDEILYQWGEESGLYWYSDKRPPASILTFPLVSGPQAMRLIRQTESALQAQPPDLIIVANYASSASEGHTVFEWIRSHYRNLTPLLADERKYFTFYVRPDADDEFVRRVLGGGSGN